MFLHVSDKKGLKTDKNKSSLQNWQFQSLNFGKLSKLVPDQSKHVNFIIKGPLGFISCQNKSFRVQVCKITILVPQLSKMSKMVLGFIKMENL